MTNGLFINGRWIRERGEAGIREVLSPYSGQMVSETIQANSAQLEEAIGASAAAFKVFKKTSRYARVALLNGIARGINDRRAELVRSIVTEAGKPLTLAEVEVSRAITTFTLAAEEAKRLGGEVVPLDLDAGGRAFVPAVMQLVPRGPVLAITPFNFPLNLAAHKIAPALAVGAPVLLKPPPQAPGAACLLAEIFTAAAEAAGDAVEKIPLAALQVVHASNEVMSPALADSRLAVLSFTGSDKVGWMLQAQAPRKKVVMELGGNAAMIVHSDADLSRAANRAAFGAFAYAGQVCISVQRVLVHRDVFEPFRTLFLAEVRKLKVGDPESRDTVVGPMIDSGNVERIQAWIEEARQAGAELVGGERSGNVLSPVVLTHLNAKRDSKLKVIDEEAFGPVVVLSPYERMEEAVETVNQSRFGLQAGVFTRDSKVITYASQNLEVGGVLINEAPIFRADHMPYGGMKDSGLGREGVRYAMHDYCDSRTVIHWQG